jgi:DNA polymerase I-like protein with 3'-5' exonuclease and polymerase domains
MRVMTFDIECTHTVKPNGSTTASPYFGNRLVAIGYRFLGEPTQYLCCYSEHRAPTEGWAETFQRDLDRADVLVAHNAKFDLNWIRACGFMHRAKVYDTMVAEYVLARAQKNPLSLEKLAEKYSNVSKKADLTKPYLRDGYTFAQIPWDIVEEYGRADVEATEQVALAQLEIYETTFEELFGGREAV